MKIKLNNVNDPEFVEYGQVLTGYDFTSFISKLEKTNVTDSVVYVASDTLLESDPAYNTLMNNYYGGMPIQIGYCNGANQKLNCLEYHRSSEVNIAATDCILLLAKQVEIANGLLDTATVRAFLVPTGVAVELFATTLHYAPCSAKNGDRFQVAVVLPLGTNTDKPNIKPLNHEDTLMTAKNKWLLSHADSEKAKKGAVIGLTGENIDLAEVLW